MRDILKQAEIRKSSSQQTVFGGTSSHFGQIHVQTLATLLCMYRRNILTPKEPFCVLWIYISMDEQDHNGHKPRLLLSDTIVCFGALPGIQLVPWMSIVNVKYGRTRS